MEGQCRIYVQILVTCLVFGAACGFERRVFRNLNSIQPNVKVELTNSLDAVQARIRREAPPFPTSSRDSNDHFIPRISPPRPGTILTYDGKPVQTNIGAFSIVPKSERRTPSINTNRPQYATFRGDLPPPIPDVIPRDLPQFKNSRSVVSGISPGFQVN